MLYKILFQNCLRISKCCPVSRSHSFITFFNVLSSIWLSAVTGLHSDILSEKKKFLKVFACTWNSASVCTTSVLSKGLDRMSALSKSFPDLYLRGKSYQILQSIGDLQRSAFKAFSVIAANGNCVLFVLAQVFQLETANIFCIHRLKAEPPILFVHADMLFQLGLWKHMGLQ